MGRPKETSREETTKDLWDYLVAFWMDTVEDAEADRGIRMKAAEHLAKYILGAGRSTVKRRGQVSDKPSTAEILRIVASMEKGSDGT